MNSKVIKIIGMAATVLGMGATLVTEWVNDKKMDEKINDAVDKALAARENDTDDEDEEGGDL